jgi:hypothetical protein
MLSSGEKILEILENGFVKRAVDIDWLALFVLSGRLMASLLDNENWLSVSVMRASKD